MIMRESIQFGKTTKEREANETIKDLQESLPILESKRLQNPRDSFLEGLRRFARRATATGALLATLSAGEMIKPIQSAAIEAKSKNEITNIYQPYFEEWSIHTSNGDIVSPKLYEKKNTVEKGEKIRSLIEEITTHIAATERLPLLKLNIEFSLDDGKRDGFLIEGGIISAVAVLKIDIRSDFDPVQDKKALEVALAHELGHLKHFSVEDVEDIELRTAWQRAKEDNPEIAKQLAEIEKRIAVKEEAEHPGYREKVQEAKALGKKIATENLTRVSAQKIRDQIHTLMGGIIFADINLMGDEEYQGLLESANTLKSDLTPAFAREVIRGGGPEMIADFFIARWAVQEHWMKKELDNALKKVLGEGKETKADIHGLDSDSRRGAILIYYDTISQNPNFWLNLPITPKTIQDNIKGLYFGHT